MIAKICPLLWRHLFLQYGKTLFLSLFGFLAVLLATRLEDTVRLVSSGASLRSVVLYIIYQIPYLLQLALPIATLIASLYLFQRLSLQNELTAVRASGISLFQLILPLTIFSIFIALFSFVVVIDSGVRAHMHAKKLEYNLRKLNPLAILQNTRLLQQQGINLDMKGSLVSDKQAQDMILTLRKSDKANFTLVLAKEIVSTGLMLDGRDLALISTKPAEDKRYDDLFIENAKENLTPLAGLSLFINKHKMWKADNDLLRMPLLMAKKSTLEEKHEIHKYKDRHLKRTKRKLNQISNEIARRVSICLAIVSFTILGAAFGVTIGRMHSKMRLFGATSLATLFLIAFLAAKGMEDHAFAALLCYFLPHAVILYFSLKRLYRIQKGIET